LNFTKKEISDLHDRTLEGATFSQCTLIETNCRDAKFIDCTFQNSALSSVKIDGAVLQGQFTECKIEGINFFTAKRELLSVGFERCLIRYSSFAELKLKKVQFTGCTLINVDFADADLSEADFSNSSFEDCVFRNTNLTKADFRGATGYAIDPAFNKVKGAIFNVPEVLGLLSSFGIVVE
jgi:fluoroquinolone resistance protein